MDFTAIQYFYLPPSPIPTHISLSLHPSLSRLPFHTGTTCDVEDSSVAQRLQILILFSLFSSPFQYISHFRLVLFKCVRNMLMQLFSGSWSCHMNIMGSANHVTPFCLTGYDEWDCWDTEGSRVCRVHLGQYWINSKNQVLYFNVFLSWLLKKYLEGSVLICML